MKTSLMKFEAFILSNAKSIKDPQEEEWSPKTTTAKERMEAME